MYVSYDFLKVFSILVQHVNILCLYGKQCVRFFSLNAKLCIPYVHIHITLGLQIVYEQSLDVGL